MKKSTFCITVALGFGLMMMSCQNEIAKTDLTNIGCVTYVKESKGAISANWAFNYNDKISIGTGNGTNKDTSSVTFDGHYSITYITDDKKNSETFDLHIKNQSSYYSLEWKIPNTDSLVYYGIGVERDGQLVAGWRQ